MLDDRNMVPNTLLAPFATWTYEQNETAWNAVLGGKQGSETVSQIAAPARLTDFGGLAPAYIEVGDLDIFRDEDIAYAQQLARASVPVELHVHPGAPHGFERFAPLPGTIPLTKRRRRKAYRARCAWLRKKDA
jgi:acetyl esterase/lipase